MAPKTNCNALKLASIITYLQNSRSCHSLKDLEKQLPAAAYISGMQVKDYLQALQDENKIRVEKIGSGNWYWSFASDDKLLAQADLERTKSTHEKLSTTVEELRAKVSELAAQHEEEDDMEESREELVARKAIAEADVRALQKELEAYSDKDPTEIERKKNEIEVLKGEVETVTDDLYAIEGWFKKQGPDAVGMVRTEYEDQWDEEEEDFKML